MDVDYTYTSVYLYAFPNRKYVGGWNAEPDWVRCYVGLRGYHAGRERRGGGIQTQKMCPDGINILLLVKRVTAAAADDNLSFINKQVVIAADRILM